MSAPLLLGTLLLLAGCATPDAGAPGAGLRLESVAVELPFDAEPYPEFAGGPSAEAMNNNCLSCHSGSMVLAQPVLSKAGWAAEVAKMRNVYKAPVDPAEDAAIIAWLVAQSERVAAAAASGS